MSRVEQFNQGARPRFDRQDALQLRTGRRFVRLSTPSGELTAAGNEYEQRTGETLPASGFQNQKAVRKGNTETIKLRDGRRATTRKWDAVSNRWSFTKLGRRYYSRLRRNWIVQVPVTIKRFKEGPLRVRNQGLGAHRENGHNSP